MKHQITAMVTTICLFFGALNVSAQQVNKIESYGVYIVADKGYVRVLPYNGANNFVDFKELNEIAGAKRKGDELKLVVYDKDFNPGNYALALRPVQTTIEINNIGFSAKPLDQKDMYELITDKPVKNGAMLHVYNYSFFPQNMGVVMLGDVETELVNYFSQKSLPNAYAVEQYLDDALAAFPKSAKLKALQPRWQQAARNEKDAKAYGYVDEKWRKYNETDKIALKARYLRDMLGEINAYLRDFPDGNKAAEARDRKGVAEQKLPEYEKQL